MSRVSTKKPASEPAGGQGEGIADDAPPQPTADQLWSKVLGWQSRREHSRAELTGKLAALGADASQIDTVLVRLGELGLQNDDRFADMLVRSQLRRGRGQRVIRQTLQQRGIASDHPALAWQTADVDWVAQARELLVRRFGESLSGEPRDKARQVRFLQYRGYSLSQALSAIASLSGGSGHDD